MVIPAAGQNAASRAGSATLAYPVHARYLRFFGEHVGAPALKLQVYGCLLGNDTWPRELLALSYVSRCHMNYVTFRDL